MRLHIRFVIVLFLTTIIARAQKFSAPLVNIGDPAPPLRVSKWLKGDSISTFEKGKIYVVEFWATWCRPCRAEIPLLSAIARKYRDSVTVIGMDIFDTLIPLRKIKAFIDSMGTQMDYSVAVADNNNMKNDWLDATLQIYMGIPTAFIVDREGRLTWMGHPCYGFEDALFKIVINKWNINESLAKRNLEFRLSNLDDSLNEVLTFAPDGDCRTDSWKRDSGLLLVDEMAKTEPLIKFTPRIAYHIFSTLVKTNTKKACEYGEKVIVTATYEAPDAFLIRGVIEQLSKEIALPPEIYQVGIDALQAEMDQAQACYPEVKHAHRLYYKMAEWYRHLGNKTKAIEALEKGIETLKNELDFNEKDLAEFKTRLKQYKGT